MDPEQRMKPWVALALAVFGTLPAGCGAVAAPLAANPSTVEQVMQRARPGDVVKLAPGAYGRAAFKRVRGVTIDARDGASVTDWTFAQAEDVTVLGGVWRNGCDGDVERCFRPALTFAGGQNLTVRNAAMVGPKPARAYGLVFRNASKVSVSGTRFEGLKSALRFKGVRGFSANEITCAHMRTDCINISSSWEGRVDGVVCYGTSPISIKEHPDCVQGWSRPELEPTADIEIRRVVAVGDTQGVFFGNHVREQPAGYRLADGSVLTQPTRLDDGGFGRILVEDVRVCSTRSQGIGVGSARALTLRNNRVSSLPGGDSMTNLSSGNSKLVESCGNEISGARGRQGRAERACAGAAPGRRGPMPPSQPLPPEVVEKLALCDGGRGKNG
jgi:hypothetical protein